MADLLQYFSASRRREANMYFIIGGVIAAAGLTCVLVSTLAFPPPVLGPTPQEHVIQNRRETQRNALFGGGLALLISAVILLCTGGVAVHASKTKMFKDALCVTEVPRIQTNQ